jgi:hypothetical protein
MMPWLAFLVTVGVLVLALEAGFWLSRVERLQLSAEQRAQASTVVAALLAVLGFVLAATFSIVESRFSTRKTLVFQEANAIGTAYLRTNFLPPAEAARSRELLSQYVDLRLAANLGSLTDVLTESEKKHQELWSLAAKAGEQRPNSLLLALYIQSLNEVIDMHQERLSVGARNRLPVVFLVILYGAATLTTGVLGFATGHTGSRNLLTILPLVLLLCSLLQVITDLDRPDMHLAKVGQGAMEDLQRSLRSEPPQEQ